MALGGYCLQEKTKWQGMLTDFWAKYERERPSLQLGASDRSLLLPFALHGDEGRGKTKRPIMILALQPLISWQGPETVNTSGNHDIL